MNEDYTKYLSVDNGNGVLISKYDAFILNREKINYCSCKSMSDLIFLIQQCLDENFNDDLEDVLSHLYETHYYQETHKQGLAFASLFLMYKK